VRDMSWLGVDYTVGLPYSQVIRGGGDRVSEVRNRGIVTTLML